MWNDEKAENLANFDASTDKLVSDSHWSKDVTGSSDYNEAFWSEDISEGSGKGNAKYVLSLIDNDILKNVLIAMDDSTIMRSSDEETNCLSYMNVSRVLFHTLSISWTMDSDAQGLSLNTSYNYVDASFISGTITKAKVPHQTLWIYQRLECCLKYWTLICWRRRRFESQKTFEQEQKYLDSGTHLSFTVSEGLLSPLQQS